MNKTVRIAMKKETTIEVLVALLFLLYLFAGVLKIATFEQYIIDMRSQRLSKELVWAATYVLPFFHLALAGLLIPAKTRRIALWLSTGLMLIYTLYIAGMYFEWIAHRPCSCTGITRNMTWGQQFWFNIAFLALSAMAAILSVLHSKKGKASGEESIGYKVQIQ